MLRFTPRHSLFSSLPSLSPIFVSHLPRPRYFSTQPIAMSAFTPVTAAGACPPAGPYSQAVRANGQVFVSGQIPADASGNLVTGNIGELTQACCNNIKAIVEAAGSSVEKIVKVNVFLTDMANFAEMNATYEKFFAHKPARSCVAVAQLPKGVPVEIECIALQ
ncbi:Endoribonuclease L-PSP/chorismate mutase-like protein [Aspergillus affinis]|uniref:Endoribonuclease L-PSP/chorismate mutase-like protein n=1 Tax=Aspergillus affinis TaxID=1070780 RepID=UPI0022FF269A|nr:Endoribonuclease L-PSP/chorismate mutase-like protein [Aspergillus affinis]KAI9039240.1 Endoribonuclease L-PSP/chorismate mutase-like protein [Aspergillus affinis]